MLIDISLIASQFNIIKFTAFRKKNKPKGLSTHSLRSSKLQITQEAVRERQQLLPLYISPRLLDKT